MRGRGKEGGREGGREGEREEGREGEREGGREGGREEGGRTKCRQLQHNVVEEANIYKPHNVDSR